ncbi:hypothetical protein [Paenibacillus dendritiformis]|uniref:hypothetical protein n=1 Tax=Paenibacillus dendritiformis TaxID=130049 RepID=UPI00387E0504
MDEIIVICIVVAAVIIGFLFFPLAKSKGWIKKDNIDGMKRANEIISLILAIIQLDNKTRDRATLILDISNMVADFALQTTETDDKSELKEIALHTVGEALKRVGILPNEAEQRLIEIVIEEGLKLKLKE